MKMLSYLILLILLPITYYSITKKTEFKTPPEFEKIEKEINEWLRSGTFQASEESFAILDKISYIDRKEDFRTVDSVLGSILIESKLYISSRVPAITDEVTAISPESYLSNLEGSRAFSDIAEEFQQVIKGPLVSR